MQTLNPNGTGSRRHDNLRPLDHVSGVYLLYIDGQIYVGSSKNLRERLRCWSAIFPGTQYAVFRCENFLEKERELILKMRGKALRVRNHHLPLRPKRIALYTRGKHPRVLKARRPRGQPSPPRLITVRGETRTLTEWCTKNKISKNLFYARLSIGKTEQEAVQPRVST